MFHGGLGGVLVLAGPTGGYLVGFFPAVFLMGWAARLAGPPARSGGPAARGGRLAPRPGGSCVLAVGAAAASAAIYALGIPWLALFGGLGCSGRWPWDWCPSFSGDVLKAAVAVGAVYLGGRALSQWRPSLF